MFIHLNTICNKNPKRPRYTSGADFTAGALARINDQTSTVVPPYPRFPFPWFQLLTVNHGPNIAKWKIPQINNS